jgi:ribosome biogenesis GTPase A
MVLIIGKTGSGKSTIINILADKKLFGKKESGNLIIDTVDYVSKIVHGGTSGTDKPTFYIDKQYTYFDCPGFFDNKGEEQEIKTAFYINYLFRQAKRVKLLIVV